MNLRLGATSCQYQKYVLNSVLIDRIIESQHGKRPLWFIQPPSDALHHLQYICLEVISLILNISSAG